jgi:rhodanese-related sulfurtransferase
MSSLSTLFILAQERGQEHGLPYPGALLPQEAAEVWAHAPGAKLVDVRSRAELDFAGHIPGAVHIEWKTYPGWALNAYFINQLRETIDPESLVMFICRTGVRSHQAAEAALAAGYNSVYNVLEGFDGERDPQLGRRGCLTGWRARKLPWEQS